VTIPDARDSGPTDRINHFSTVLESDVSTFPPDRGRHGVRCKIAVGRGAPLSGAAADTLRLEYGMDDMVQRRV
jgi:hypothetical protein